jgi:hypothetical protein
LNFLTNEIFLFHNDDWQQKAKLALKLSHEVYGHFREKAFFEAIDLGILPFPK